MKQPIIINKEDIPVTTKITDGHKSHYIGHVRPFNKDPEIKQFNKNRNLGLAIVDLYNKEIHRNHVHEYDSMIIVISGTATLTGVEERVIKKGDIICVPKNTVHGFTCDQNSHLEVISIQPDSRGFFDDISSNVINFSQSNYKKLLKYNELRCAELKTGKFFTVTSNGMLRHSGNKLLFYKFLSLWSEKFQTILFSRQASCVNADYSEVFNEHLMEEIGHEKMLNKSDKWDAIIDAGGDWFVAKMGQLDDIEKLVVVHLILEKAGDTYHTFAKEHSEGEDPYIDLHAQLDHGHCELGADLLQHITDKQCESLIALSAKSWDVLTVVLERIAHLFLKEVNATL